jgi:ABC-2 type transport system ATP-binding protein
VTAFAGPNGAGKSTTIRVILGLDAPDEGRALVCGQAYQHLRHPLRYVGALLDAAALQPSRTAHNHLLWIEQSQNMTASRVDAVIELVGLGSAARRKAGGYSLGMCQGLGIAAAMDEPFNGLA